MIYFLDNSLQLQKIVTSKNVISAIHEHELNGLIRADVELDLSYANKFLILGIDHVGYYYKDEFYLHKVQRVEYDHVNETALVVLRHVFFEDMIFGKLIQDVRPQNQDALTVSRQTIDTNTRWQTIMTDVTGRLSTNFYWQVPYEVIEFMTENYRIEYLPKILFDGQKINGFQLHLANKIGEDKNIRIPYGSRVLDLKYEEDYSEIITKLAVHGKGEEVGDGYGRRINISDVNFSRNGVESPVGSLYLEDESITNTYGNDGQTPREGREVFEDIEDANELAEAGYQHYLQVSRPQMLFTADVADIGDVGIGDSVMIIRREYDVYFNARIHKLSVDLLYPEDAQVELGDYEHFKESKIARKSREKNNRVQGQLSDRITRLKQEADERFDNEVGQWKSEYEQALIDVHAEIEADRENMTNLIEGTRTEFTDNLTAEITQTKDYAEQQAQAKADSVQSNLDSFKGDHQQLYEEVTGNLSQTRIDLLERINNIDTQSFNLIRGSRFDEPDRYTTAGGTVHDDEDMPYFRYGINSGNVQYISTVDDIQFESGKTYTLSLDYRTSSDVSIDYLRIIPTDGSADINIRNNITESDMAGIIPDGLWHRTFLTFTVPRNLTGTLRLGSDFSTSVKGQTDIRLPYLTTSGNTQWVFHPSDSYESIISVMSRIDEFEQSVWAELEGVYGNLSSTRTELQNQLDAARAEFEEIEYENRNLFVQSSELRRLAEIDDREVLKTRGYFINSVEVAYGDPLIIKRDLISGATYTLSGRFDAPNHPSVPNHNAVYLHHESGRINVGKFPPNYENHSFTFRVPENLTQTFLAFDTGAYEAYIEKDTLKLEQGKKATPYSKAPEDTEHKITTLNQQIEYIDGQLSAKLEQTDIEPINNKITEYGNSLTANAQSIESLISKSELHEGDITQWSNLSRETAEGLERTIGRVSTAEGKLSNAEFDIKVNADSLKLTATKTEVENAIEGIEVGGRNLVLNTGGKLYRTFGSSATLSGVVGATRLDWTGSSQTAMGEKLSVPLITGETYTVTFEARGTIASPYLEVYILVKSGANMDVSKALSERVVTEEFKKYTATFKYTGNPSDRLFIGGRGPAGRWLEVKDGTVKLEKGNKATDWTPAPEDTDAKISKVTSDLIVEADRIENLVTDISTDYVKQSAVKVTSDRVTIGSTIVNGSTIGSVLSVSPSGIDAVADAMRLSGDLFVAGEITSLAVNAIEGNFTRLFANELTTDVIKSSHIEASTSLIRKLFVNSARIDELITQTHFVNEMHALTMDVVDLNAAQIRTRILSANTIDASWLKSDVALIDRIFSSTAMFERMMSKTGFVTSFGAVTISADQITSGTLHAHNDNFYLNLSTGNMYFRSGANIRFYNEGVAMQHSKLNYTVGMSFEPHPRSAQYPAVWMGGTTSSSVVADHSSFTGIWAVPYNNELDISARHIRIRSGSGFVDSTERLINIKMDHSSEAEIYPSHTATRRYYIGRKSNKFWTVFSQYINGIRFDDGDTYQSLTRGNNGIEFNDSQGLILIHKGERYNLDYILNRLAY